MVGKISKVQQLHGRRPLPVDGLGQAPDALAQFGQQGLVLQIDLPPQRFGVDGHVAAVRRTIRLAGVQLRQSREGSLHGIVISLLFILTSTTIFLLLLRHLPCSKPLLHGGQLLQPPEQRAGRRSEEGGDLISATAIALRHCGHEDRGEQILRLGQRRQKMGEGLVDRRLVGYFLVSAASSLILVVVVR